MPPKKKNNAKNDAGKGGKKDGSKQEELEKPSEREILLQRELDTLLNQYRSFKKEVAALRKENEFLQQEAQQTRIESHEYMSYMAKRTNKRQNAITNLSDKSALRLEKIKNEKDLLLQAYARKKKTLNDDLNAKESKLAQCKSKFDSLAEYQELKRNNLKTIKNLEEQVVRIGSSHSETIQQMKAQFLKEKSEYSDLSQEMINALIEEANKKAVKCLDEHASSIKHENRALRTELLELINSSRVLNARKKELDDQKKELIRERHFSDDIRRIRKQRNQQIIKMLDKNNQA